MEKILNKIKKTDIKGQYKLIYVLMYVFIVFTMLGINNYTSNLEFLNESNSLFLDPSEFDEDFSVYQLTEEDGNTFDYTVKIPSQAYENLEGDEYRLIINGIRDNAIKVWFNDNLIISLGDLEDGLSMIRSSHVYGSIESSMIEAENLLKIQTYADNRSGTDKAIIFTEKIPGERAIRLLTTFNEWFIVFGISFIFMLALFTLIIYFLNSRSDKLLLILSLATFSLSFYFFDFISVNLLTEKYMLWKKYFLFMLSLGVFFYGFALYIVIQKKYILVIPILQFIFYIYIMISSKTMLEFKANYNYFYYSLALIVLVLFLESLFNLRKNRRVFILFLHFSSMISLGLIQTSKSFESGYFSIALPIFIMFAIGFLPMIIIFDLFLAKELKFLEEKQLKDHAYKQSMTDDLTGVWNKRYLESRIYDLSEKSVLALIDVDNLKTINDTYGHLAGDEVLRQITKTIRKNIRKADDICRYGGDEFVVIFEDCSIKDAVLIIDKIRKIIAENEIYFNDVQLISSISTGLCAASDELKGKKLIECADQQLYIAKKRGKNSTEYDVL